LAEKSLIQSKPSAAKDPAKIGNGRSVQRSVVPGLFSASAVQRKEQPGGWVHKNVQSRANNNPAIQPKVKIHAANDKFEKEADQVADNVVSSNQQTVSTTVSKVTPATQRKVLSSAKNRVARNAAAIQLKHSSAQNSFPVQTKPGSNTFSCALLQCADSGPPTSQSHNEPNKLQSVLSNQNTRGSPLPQSTRTHMESRMGADFSNVRIHTGAESQEASHSIGARAFTNGQHIHFGEGQFNPHTNSGKHLLAHELTHTVQQGASPALSSVQRSALNINFSANNLTDNSQRGPPVQSQCEASTVQCSMLDNAIARVGELLDDLPSLSDGLDGVKRWLTGKLHRFASWFPGYSALCVVLGHDIITGEHIDRSGANFINAALDIIPGGSLLKQKLEELGAIERAGAWIDGQMETLSSILSNIQDEFTREWNSLGVISFLAGPTDKIRAFGGIFERALNNLINFAERAASELLSIVKEFLLTQLVNFIKNHTNAYELLKVIIGHDPITEEHVDRNGTNILNALLELGGEAGREQRRQMQDTGTFQKAADWIDRGIAVFGNLYQTIRDNFGMIWDAVSIQSLMDPVGTFTRIYNAFAEPVRAVLAFVEDALRAILGLIKEVLMQRLSVWARTIRGYPLVTVLIGKDPFTDAVVERNVPNIIRGFMSLMEGGEEQYRQMEESGAIGRATAQINAAVARLNMTPASIVQLFIDLWNSFSFNDLTNPIAAFQRIIERFGEPIARIIAFIIEIVRIVIYVILQVMNFPFDIINNIITRAMAAFESIKRDPIGFLKNLLRAIKQGFVQFFNNILVHLRNGLVGWLMSELRDANVPQPTDFSLRGIIGWGLQVLGISMEAIWQKLAAHPRIGPERVARLRSMIDRLEGIWTFIRDVQQRGMAAIWDKIQEQLSNLWSTVMEAVKNWIMERIISQVTARLLSMLDPTGIMAVINSVIAIYRAVQSFIRYLRQMLEVVNSFVNGVADIAEGNITTAANYLENTMDRAMPIVIGFLANQVGLSGIGRRIGEMINSARALIDRALTWLVNRAVDTGFAIFDRLMSMGRSAVSAVAGWLGYRREFRTPRGETHSLYFEGSGENAELTVASEPRRYRDKLRDFVTAGTMTTAQFNAISAKLMRLQTLRRIRAAVTTRGDDSDIINLVNEIATDTAPFMDAGSPALPFTSMPIYHLGVTRSGYSKGVKVERLTKNGPAGTPPTRDMYSSWPTLDYRRQGSRPFFIKGHLLSNYYGGSGSETRNLAPMFQNHNSSFAANVERLVKTKYDSNHMLYFEVVVDYNRSANPNKAAILALETNAIKRPRLEQVIDAEPQIPTHVTLAVDDINIATGVRTMNTILSETNMTDIQNQRHDQYEIQTKLKLANQNGYHEREADRVADHVSSNEKISSTISISRINGGIQTKTNDDKKPTTHLSTNNKVETALASQHTRGSPLPAATRAVMENKIGADFSKVRIHTGQSSDKANDSIGSKAFTQGANIHFGKGEFNPATKAGQHLLAHELTHTVQQGAAPQKAIAQPADTRSEKIATKGSTVTKDLIASKDTAAPKLAVANNAVENKNKQPVAETNAATASPAISIIGKDKPGEKEKTKTTASISSAEKPATGKSKNVAPVSTSKAPGKTPGSGGAKEMKAPQINEEQPLAAISSYTPTQIGKGFTRVQEQTSASVTKLSNEKINNLPKVALASGSAYGSPVSKHSKGYKEGTAAKGIDGLEGKSSFVAPLMPETQIPGDSVVTPVNLPVSEPGKDEVDAAKAGNTLDSVALDTEGIPVTYEEKHEVELTGEASPGNMDEAMDLQSSEINNEKNEAAKDINLDYGENNVIKKPGAGNITTRKKVKPAVAKVRPLAKNNSYPDYFEAKAASFSNGNPYRQMDAETGKYYLSKQSEEDKMEIEEQKSKQQIEEQSQLSRQGQANAQRIVISKVGAEKKQWGIELDQTEKNFFDSSVSAKAGFNQSIKDEKAKGDIEIQKKIDEANTKAAKEHAKAQEDVEKEKKKKKEESKGFWGWLRSKASALIDALKSFVHGIFNMLRKLVKGIFDLLKKLVVGLLEMVHKLVVGLIKGFGALLKGFASIALAAFPETRRRVVGAIDSAVDTAVEATDKAFEVFEKAVSDIIDFVADVVDTALAIIQKVTDFAFDVIKGIVVGLLYVLEYLLNLEKLYKLYRKLIDGFNYLWDHPEVVEKKVIDFLQGYIDNVPTEAPAEVTKALKQFGLNIVKHVTGVMNYLMPSLKKMTSASYWWKMAKDMIWYLIWPFAEGSPLWEDAPKLWHLIPQIWNDFWNGDFNRAVDGCLEWMQALNSVLGLFSGWIIIGSVIVGAIIGAFFGGAGAIPGAAAGLEVGLAIGEGIMALMIATETGVILKAVLDLAITTDDGEVTTPAAREAVDQAQQENPSEPPDPNAPTIRQSGDVKTGKDRIEFAYQRIANSALALGFMAALIALGSIGGKIAQAIAGGVKKLLGAIGEAMPGLAEGLGKLGTSVKESKLGSTLSKASKDFNAGRVEMKGKIDNLKAKVGLGKAKPMENEVAKPDEKVNPDQTGAADSGKQEKASPDKPMIHEGGEKIIDTDKSLDGNRELEFTEDGHCKVCSSPCDKITEKYKVELEQHPEYKTRLDDLSKKYENGEISMNKLKKEVKIIDKDLAEQRRVNDETIRNDIMKGKDKLPEARVGDKRTISQEEYDQLREKTPSQSGREHVNKDFVAGQPDEALPGLTVDKPFHADHIVSMDRVTRMDGFGELTTDQKLRVLNYEENMYPLSETANTSKGAKAYAEWLEYKKGNIKVSPEFTAKMVTLETEVEKMIQAYIDKLLKKP